MRLAAYAGASTALAAGVVIYAFNQRANFYSACVYLAQSNLCLMILTNLILFLIATFMFGLQRTFYGPLRPIEIEQLYEKAWFAITETCLAMTIFREEVGAWFLVMFVALLIGKIWGWIGEGRVEVLEQQPPANPRLFHIRLSFSLAVSVIYDMWIMAYTISTVIQQARPNMMVMFLFEFAILTTSSYSTVLRYIISLIETRIVKKQTQERLEIRRREVREERAEILRQREAAASSSEASTSDEATGPLPSEEDVDESDIEVPGWEAKGQWVLSLDLVTDFVKLGIYAVFFFVLLTFYGLPIHITRDLFLTARSFAKRLTAFIKYRNATKDMNRRYPDATVEEIQREDTCIICREEMKPWSVTNPEAVPAPDPANIAAAGATQPPAAAPVNATAGAAQPSATRSTSSAPVNERYRPKKLPCGHVLHLGCLKSWLERQQVCPTCRRPVMESRTVPAPTQRPGQAPQAPGPGQLPLPDGGVAGQAPAPPANVAMGGAINIGPFRLNFGRGPLNPGGGPAGQPNAGHGNARIYGLELGFPPVQPPANGAPAPAIGSALPIHEQLQLIEQQIRHEIQSLHFAEAELGIVRELQAQLVRLHALHDGVLGQQARSTTRLQSQPPLGAPPLTLQRHGALGSSSAIPSGSPDLPPGVTIPEGWSLLPLQNVETLLPPTTNPPHPVMLHNHPAASQNSGINIQPANIGHVGPIGPVLLAAPLRSQMVPPVGTLPTMNGSSVPEPPSSLPANTVPEPSHPSISPPSTTDPTALPRWGSPQLFAPQNTNGTATSDSQALPTPLPKLEPSSAASEQPMATSSVAQSEDVPMQDRDKGKGKAATVEDTTE